MKSKKSFITTSRGGTRITNDTPDARGLLFNKVQTESSQFNTFANNHGVTMSGKMGKLLPVLTMEVLPGETHRLNHETYIKYMPLTSPVMHQMNQSVHTWFIPNRLLWPEEGASLGWEKFISGETVDHPYITVTDALTAAQKKFLDYMGVPPIPVGGTPTRISALPLAAYQFLYNQKYRDQNLIAEVNWKLIDGDNSANTDLLVQRNVSWEHDLFTSALPSATFGASVEIPLGTIVKAPDAAAMPHFETMGGVSNTGVLADVVTGLEHQGSGDSPLLFDPDGTLETSPTTIKDLRRAIKIQEFLELLGRTGKRYYEIIKTFFPHARQNDARLQQPEFITGTKTPVVISETLNTSATATEPQGNQSGNAISFGNGQGNSYTTDEHGFIISVLFVTPRSSYMQGIPRLWSKFDQYDYFWNKFEHIGEQALLNQEVYAYTPQKDGEFGYVPRYSEYKYMPDRVAGDMRTTLLYWHMGRKFTALPTLSQSFIEIDPDADELTRIFAVEDGTDYLLIDIYHHITSRRPMAVFGNPNL